MQSLIIIMGLNPRPGADLLGLEDFALRMISTYGAQVFPFAHDRPDLRQRVLSMLDDQISGGGPLRSVCLLDPKPKPWWQWWNPFFEFNSNAVQTVAEDARCFYGGFGRPFKGRWHSEFLGMPHEDFPASAIAQEWIESQIQRVIDEPCRPGEGMHLVGHSFGGAEVISIVDAMSRM